MPRRLARRGEQRRSAGPSTPATCFLVSAHGAGLLEGRGSPWRRFIHHPGTFDPGEKGKKRHGAGGWGSAPASCGGIHFHSIWCRAVEPGWAACSPRGNAINSATSEIIYLGLSVLPPAALTPERSTAPPSRCLILDPFPGKKIMSDAC